MVQSSESNYSRARWLYFALGWLFFALGALGTILPLLPTTPFMLLAVWCFARSSRRFQNWLLHHRLFGPPVRAWIEHRVIPLKVKLLSWSTMSASFALMLYRRVPWPLLVAAGLIMLYGAVFIARCRSKRPPLQPATVPQKDRELT